MRKLLNTIKGVVLATALLAGGYSYAEDDGCGSCSALKVIEKAQQQGVTKIISLSYSLGNWKVSGKDGQNIDIEAKIHCPQQQSSKAEVVSIGKASRVPASTIVSAVKKLTTGKIQSVSFNGYYWKVVVVEQTVELEYHFDQNGKLTGQLTTD